MGDAVTDPLASHRHHFLSGGCCCQAWILGSYHGEDTECHQVSAHTGPCMAALIRGCPCIGPGGPTCLLPTFAAQGPQCSNHYTWLCLWITLWQQLQLHQSNPALGTQGPAPGTEGQNQGLPGGAHHVPTMSRALNPPFLSLSVMCHMRERQGSGCGFHTGFLLPPLGRCPRQRAHHCLMSSDVASPPSHIWRLVLVP